MLYSQKYNSPIGDLKIVSDKKNIVGLWIKGQKYFESTIYGEEISSQPLPILEMAKQWLNQYFSGEKPLPKELSLKPKGSEFRKLVWEILCKIPYGEVTTYGEIAKEVAQILQKDKMSAQAVGGAVGHNPISIIIPCHRVIGASGDLIGYAGGIELKKKLLDFEKS